MILNDFCFFGRPIACLAAVLSLACGGMTSVAADDAKTPEAMSLLGKPLIASPQDVDTAKLEADLKAARVELAKHPDRVEAIDRVGRRLDDLWRMKEAIEVYSEGLKHHPQSAALYRHRSHCYISMRQFDRAISDLEIAAELMRDKVDVMEENGPTSRVKTPLTTLKYNIYYHLGVARYLKGDFAGAVEAFRKAKRHVRMLDDNRIVLTDWTYISLRRLGHHSAAKSELINVDAGMNAIENGAYYRRLRMYTGEISPEQLIPDDASGPDRVTLRYGLANWYRVQGDAARAKPILKKIVNGSRWTAFGYIAAEVDLAGMKGK